MTDLVQKKIKVLIVDDSRQVLFVTSSMLSRLGFEVVTANNGRSGFMEAYNQKPDIILLDVMMPVVDGFKICQLIKSKPETQHIPVIMLTARKSTQDILRAKEVGADGYVIKPVTMDVILEKIKSELSARGKDVSSLDKASPMLRKQRTEVSDRPAVVQMPSAKDIAAEMGAEQAAPNAAPAAHGTGGHGEAGSVRQQLRIDSILNKARDMLALPHSVNKALKVTADDASGANDLAKIITSDVAITAMVLKKANSVYFGARKRVTDVQEAIVRIGFNQTRSIVVGLSILKLFSTQQKADGFNRINFWEHCLSVGSIAKHLAANAGYSDPQEAFIAGLVHDIGKIILDENVPDSLERALHKSRDVHKPLHEMEKEVNGVTHLEVGRAILDKWKLSARIQHVAGSHANLHMAEQVSEEADRRLVKIVYYANVMAKMLNAGESGDTTMEDILPSCAEFLKLSKGLPEKFISGIFADIDDYKSFLGISQTTRSEPDESSKTVLILDPSSKPINVHREYLHSNGYYVRVVKTLGDVFGLVTTLPDKPPLVIFDLIEPFGDPNDWEKTREIARLGILTLFLLPDAAVDAYDDQKYGPSVYCINKPVDTNLLLQEVIKHIGASEGLV